MAWYMQCLAQVNDVGQTPWQMVQTARRRGIGWYIGVERLLCRTLGELRLKIYLDRPSVESDGMSEAVDAEQNDVVSLA